MTPDKLSKEGRLLLRDMEFDDEEKLVCEIRKHPIGLVTIYFIGFFITLAMTAMAILGYKALGSDVSMEGATTAEVSLLQPVVLVMGLLLAFGALVVTGISAYLYVNNVVLVTSEKIAQVLRLSLFHRKTSQLSIGDVQDVTVTKKGILAHIFDYGTLVVETAGEQQNYNFTYTPHPYEASQSIVAAHESNLKQYGN